MAEQLRRERLRREMIDEIIGTARLLLEKDGPNAISVRAIARQLGVTGPAIYRYYPSLDALMSALSESVISELCAAVESARAVTGCSSHSAYAAAQLPQGMPLVRQVCTDVSNAPVSPKLRALLDIAAATAKGGLSVTQELVDAARAEGATDTEIHDCVLIAAAFCMFNRYVDGLGTFAPDDQEAYSSRAQRIVDIGYLGLLAESQQLSPGV